MENMVWQSASGCTSCQPRTDVSLEGYVTHGETDVTDSCKCCRMGRPGQQADMRGPRSCCPAAHKVAQGPRAACYSNAPGRTRACMPEAALHATDHDDTIGANFMLTLSRAGTEGGMHACQQQRLLSCVHCQERQQTLASSFLAAMTASYVLCATRWRLLHDLHPSQTVPVLIPDRTPSHHPVSNRFCGYC